MTADRPFMYNKVFLKKTLTYINFCYITEVFSPCLYASFGTFCAQIGQSFEAQWVFEVCLEIKKSLLSKENVVDFGILGMFKYLLCRDQLTNLDAKGIKRSVKCGIQTSARGFSKIFCYICQKLVKYNSYIRMLY